MVTDRSRLLARWSAVLLVAFLGSAASAATRQPVEPVILSTDTLALTPGSNVVVKLRGLRLDDAWELRVGPSNCLFATTIREIKKIDPPAGFEAKDVGDIRVEATVAVPAAAETGAVELRVTTPKGTSAPWPLRVESPAGKVAEQEPNGGFREAQPIRAGDVVCGRIQADKDVDVFRLPGRAGSRITIEVRAARSGSILDGILALHDARSSLIVSNDDGAGRDPRLECVLPADGDYFVVLIDAHDRGGEWHPYELKVVALP